MIIKLLIFGYAFYSIYRYIIKPMLPKVETQEEEPTKMRFTQQQKQEKQVDESDYIDYEEVD